MIKMDSYNNSLATMHQELDSVMGTVTRIPRLLSVDGFTEWKYRFEQYVKMKEPKAWRRILRGPTRITMTLSDTAKTTVDKPIDDYTDEDFDKIEEDDKALALITMSLSPDIAQGFREYKSAKASGKRLKHSYNASSVLLLK